MRHIAASLVTMLAAMLASPALQAAPAISLTVGEGFREPLGFHEASPRFSWKLPPGVQRQTAYRLVVTTAPEGWDGGWDSGWVKSDRSTFVPYGGRALRSRDRVRWRVNFRDDQGREGGWSAPQGFELGLLSAVDWKARWIAPAGELPADREPVGHLRRTFAVSKPVARARLYATARGVFTMRLNGERVGKDHFANGFTVYGKRLDTLTYDVTRHVRAGDNALEGLLGTGWYAGRFPFETKTIGPYGRNAALLAQLEITYTDGSREVIATNESWQGTFDGPILSSSFYDGENVDARRQATGWKPVVAEGTVGHAALTPKPFAPVRQVQTLAPLAITEPQPGRFVFDLGQNMVGWARIKLPLEKDQLLTLRFAEMLNDDGTLYTANYRTARSTDSYVAANSGEVEWEPEFTFHGFRYVELSGVSPGVKPAKSWVTGVVLASDLPATGSFASSHAKLNQLQSNIAWSWRGNSLDIPTDCPQRDERAGWTGDAQVFAPTALFNTDSLAFWKSWLRSMRDDQDADGVIADIIPAANQKWRTRSPGWMDAATIIPWDLYVRSGDIAVLEDNYEMMRRLVDWYHSRQVGYLLPETIGHGDWLQPHAQARITPQDRMGDRRGDTPRPLLGVAFYARSAQVVADTARVLGRHDDAKRYSDEAAAVRAAFTTEYFDADGKLRRVPETQTAYALAIAFDLLPPALIPKAGENLARLVREANNHLRTGFLGTPHLVPALERTGHGELAAQVLFQESYPSWFYPIDQGATTMWERWNSYTRDAGFGDATMNSFNHYAYGAIGQWLYERVAGITPDATRPGYRHFFVRPLFVKQLDHAQATFESPHGRISAGWVRRDGKVVLDVEVPPNTTATIEYPGRPPRTVAAGRHRFD
jgi:alpha-L-rhamnosidase